MLNVTQIEELKNDFSPKILEGKTLPNPKSVADGQVFYLQASDAVFVEHIMFRGKWHKKIIDSDSQVILREV